MEGLKAITSHCVIFTAIWRAVSEDFSIFDVDVTTEEPQELASSQSSGAAVRVAIGGSSADWFGGAAGGVAWIGSFGQQGWNVAYVFSKTLGNAPKSVWEAASHEGEGGGPVYTSDRIETCSWP